MKNHRLHRLKSQITQIIKIFLFFVTFQLLVTSYQLPVFAAPHISGKHIPGQPKDHVHKIPDVRQLRAIGLSPKAIQQAIGATGTKKVAVILVNFSDLGTGTVISTSPTISDFTGIQNYIIGLTTFYYEVTYNALSLEFVFFPNATSSYALSNSMSYYGTATGIPPEEKGAELIRDALQKNTSITTGTYHAVMVVHAGYGNEAVSSSNTGDIWSAFYGPFGNTQGFTEGLVVPETAPQGYSPFGVYCHEFGHQLGLPDLYNTVTGKSQVGYWCLMDMGTWAVNGSSPSHPSVWCKDLLSWIEPVSITSSVINCSLSAVEISSQAIKVPIPTASDPNNEYFLLEYRRKNEPSAKYDKGLPGEGILIWHIDDTKGYVSLNDINNYTTRRVDLEEADSDDPLSDYGDSTDPWPGTKNTFLAPQSNAYNGSESGITVTNFSTPGTTMTFGVMMISAAPSLVLKKYFNYPNPTYDGKTTIQFTLTRPPQDLAIDIYNLAGERVKSVPKSETEINISKSANEKWVYEYKWEGINQEGEKLASGIYFYVIKADKEAKVGKLAIIR